MFRSVKTVFVLVFIFLTTTGCVEKHLFTDSTDYYMALQRQNVSDEIIFLEKIVEEKKTAETGNTSAETYLFLALLYSHENNPAPDYDKAAKALEYYEKTARPAENERLEIRHLQNILKATNRNRTSEGNMSTCTENEVAALKAANESLLNEKNALSNQCASLRQKNDLLNKENQTMKNRIDQLKMLDIELEQKKRSIR